MAYLNGQLPSSALGTIPGTAHRVRVDLVTQTAALRAAFEKHFGRPLLITDSYRPHAEQVAVFRRYFTTDYAASAKLDRKVWDGRTWWRRPGFPSAAVPGTSVHGKGAALDLGSGVNFSLRSPEHLWMREHGPRFGWHHPYWAHDPRRPHMHEPWHFEAVAVPVSNYRTFLTGVGVTVPGVTAPTPLVPLEDAMYVISSPGRGSALVGPGYYRHLNPGEEADAAKGLVGAGNVRDGNDRQYDLWVSLIQTGTPSATLTADQHRWLENVYAAMFSGGASTPEGKSLLTLVAEARTPTAVVRDLEDDALAALAATVRGLPQLVIDEQDRRARARLA